MTGLSQVKRGKVPAAGRLPGLKVWRGERAVCGETWSSVLLSVKCEALFTLFLFPPKCFPPPTWVPHVHVPLPILQVQFNYHFLHEQFLMPTEKWLMSPLLGSLLCSYLAIHVQFTHVSTTESNSDWPIVLNKYLLINKFSKSPGMLMSRFITNPIVFVQIHTSFHHIGLNSSNSCPKSPGSHNFYLYRTIFTDPFQFK